jgi:hypothetical protein
MPIDPSIVLSGVQGPPQPITLNSIAQMMQMRQQAQQMQQQRAVQNSLAAIYSDPSNLGPDGMPNAQAMLKIARVSPQAAQSMTAQKAAIDEKLAITSKDQAEAGLQAQKYIQTIVRDPALNAYDEALASGKSPQQARDIAQKIYSEGLDSLFAGGYVSDTMKSQVPQNFDPVRVRANSLSYKDAQNLAGKKEDRAEKEAYQSAQLKLGEARLGLEEQRVGIEGARERREAGKDQAGGGQDLSDDAINNAAARYNLDGTLPPMGMGKAGMNLRTEILNRAAKMASGKDPTEQRVQQIANKADASALLQLRKQQTAGENFEKTALKNADLALAASEKMDRTGVPVFNKWLQAGRRGTGSVEAANFDAANNSFVEEYAKVMTGSTGGAAATDSARQRAHELLDTSMTPEQYRSNVDILKKEMANRVQSFREQAEETEGRIRDTGKKSDSGTSQAKTVHWDDLQ